MLNNLIGSSSGALKLTWPTFFFSSLFIIMHQQLLDQIQLFVHTPQSPTKPIICCTNVDPTTSQKLQQCKDRGIVQDIVTSPSRITHLVTQAVNSTNSTD